eukprot:m.51542 g.51542  ORF g.51542 m.51542 type:complete len:52 (-) comp21461_c1_seq1:276-431(-)
MGVIFDCLIISCRVPRGVLCVAFGVRCVTSGVWRDVVCDHDVFRVVCNVSS